MATKSSTTTKSEVTKSKTKNKKTDVKHDLLYIMSPSCGWCGKANPVVDELRKDGYEITQLDVNNPEEAKRAEEVKAKYNAQCGTPLFLDAETGNMKCGFAEKDVLEKWANGEEIPAPPRPKTAPPQPPTDFNDQAQVNTFKESYATWSKENDHLPKILPVDDVLNRMEQAQKMRDQKQQQGAPDVPNPAGNAAPNPQLVPANSIPSGTGHLDNRIVDSRLQILESKNTILEAKLDQIINSLGGVDNRGGTARAPMGRDFPHTADRTRPREQAPTNQPPKREVDVKVREQAAKAREAAKNRNANSKTNKKTVKGF